MSQGPCALRMRARSPAKYLRSNILLHWKWQQCYSCQWEPTAATFLRNWHGGFSGKRLACKNAGEEEEEAYSWGPCGDLGRWLPVVVLLTFLCLLLLAKQQSLSIGDGPY